VVEREHLVAQHRQAVEIVMAFVVFDGGDAGLQARDVGLQRNRNPIAEPTLESIEHDAQEPRQRRADTETDCSNEDPGPVVFEQSGGEQREPQCDERVRQRREQSHRERQHQTSGFGSITQPDRAP
jgi:hypothetical protein